MEKLPIFWGKNFFPNDYQKPMDLLSPHSTFAVLFLFFVGGFKYFSLFLFCVSLICCYIRFIAIDVMISFSEDKTMSTKQISDYNYLINGSVFVSLFFLLLCFKVFPTTMFFFLTSSLKWSDVSSVRFYSKFSNWVFVGRENAVELFSRNLESGEKTKRKMISGRFWRHKIFFHHLWTQFNTFS